MSQRPPGLPTLQACQLLGLPRSSWSWTQAEPSAAAHVREVERVRLRERIEALCLEFPGYGYRRVTAQLQREGWAVNHKCVQTIMQTESLQCHVKRSWIGTTQSDHPYRRYPNRLGELTLTGINQLWVADITYLRLRRQFLYLAVLLDSYSRRVVGWELADTLEARLCVAALERALAARKPTTGWVHHSDQGVQYASAAYVSTLEAAGAQISMARRGNPYDNAQAESFMKTLKREEVHLVDYENEAHARQRLTHFLDRVYNTQRLHSRLGYRPPAEFEVQLVRPEQTPTWPSREQ
jgi:transposase InsO family protein